MRNFSFYNPTRLHFGHGQIARLVEEIPPGSRVLATHSGAGILQNGIWAEVERTLQGYAISRFPGIEANPQYDTLLRAVAQARHDGCDFILAIGGNAVIDASKFLAAALCHPGDPLQLLCGTPIRAALPLGCVLAQPTGGAQSTPHGVVSHVERQQKLPFSSPLLYPRFTILDPGFMLPAQQIGNAVVETFAHTLEQYLTYPADAPLQDRYAEGLLLTLLEEGPKALAAPDDYRVQANLMWCAIQAHNGPLGCGVPQDWNSQRIGHELSLLYHLDPVQALALVLPALLSERREAKQAKLLQYAARVWQLQGGDQAQRIEDAITATGEFFRGMGLPTRLAEHGLDAEAVPEVLARLQRYAPSAEDEPDDIDLATCERILLRAL
jgi:NADP-dependent alcohol dehydrogenase